MKILSAFRFHLVIVLAAAAWVPLAAVPAARLDPASRASARADWQAAPAEPAGTGRISVLVIAADTEKPIPRVRVNIGALAASPVRTPPRAAGPSVPGTSQVPATQAPVGPTARTPSRVVQTDERGVVEFTGLPAGTYNVSALFTAYAADPEVFVPPEKSEWTRLPEGGTAAVTIRMVRAGGIIGRVVDQDGAPVPKARVYPVQRPRGAAGFQLKSAPATTDFRGQFRIYGLRPDDYFVYARFDSQASPEKGGAEAAAATMGYAPTYFPGARSLDGARPVRVFPAQDSPGVNVVMPRVKLARVTAVATDSSGRPLPAQDSDVYLTPKDGDPVGGPQHGQRESDGSFRFLEVPPGEYRMVAEITRDTTPVGAANGSRRWVVVEGAWMPVTVDREEVAVEIRTNLGATLSGRVVWEGTPPALPKPTVGAPGSAPSSAYVVTVDADPAPSTNPMMWPLSLGRQDPTIEADAFRLTGVRGAVVLTAASRFGAVKSIRRGLVDLSVAPLELTGTERITDIEVVLTTETGDLAGVVTDAVGIPIPGADVLVCPEDLSRCNQMSLLRRPTRTSTGARPAAPRPGDAGTTTRKAAASDGPGRFSVLHLLPGRYLVAARTLRSDVPVSMDVVDAIRSRGTLVTITARQTTTVDIRVEQ